MKHILPRMVQAHARGLPVMSVQPGKRALNMVPNSPLEDVDDLAILSCNAAAALFYHTDRLANFFSLPNDSGSRLKVAADNSRTNIDGGYLPDDQGIHDAIFLSY